MDYDWIPMTFELKFYRSTGLWSTYRIVAHSEKRDLFTTYIMPSGQVGNDEYPLEALLERLKHDQGTINGMTMDELQRGSVTEESEIDISSLI